MSTVPLSQYDYFDPAVLGEPYDFYRRLREESPVYKVRHPELDKDIYLVTTYGLVQEVGAKESTGRTIERAAPAPKELAAGAWWWDSSK